MSEREAVTFGRGNRSRVVKAAGNIEAHAGLLPQQTSSVTLLLWAWDETKYPAMGIRVCPYLPPGPGINGGLNAAILAAWINAPPRGRP